MLPQFLCFLPPHQGLQLRRERYCTYCRPSWDKTATLISSWEDKGAPATVPAKCRFCRGNWQVSVARVCILLPARPHPHQLSLSGWAPLSLLREVHGYRQPPPPPPQPRGWSSSWDKALQHSSDRFEETMLGNEVISLNPSLPLHPACPPKPSPALLRLWATKEVSLQCCEGNECHLTNIYSNERTSGQIYTRARGSHDLQRCCPVLGSCRGAASQSRSFSVHKTACCNFRYCCFLQSFQAL